MFSDKSFECVSFHSSWKRERSLADSGCQTRDLEVDEKAVQSRKYHDQKVQTDEEKDKGFHLADDRSGHLAQFLSRVEPYISKVLERNVRSHAFDEYTLSSDDDNSSVSCIYKLTNAEFEEKLQITGLSWNSTGAVVAAGYGRYDHEDWCTHKTALCTWNLERRKVDENKPDTVLELPCCLMCVAFHPTNPAVIAGGTFNGSVLLWDLSKEDDMLLTESGQGDDSHNEPVSKVIWVPDTTTSKKNKYLLMSISGDGKMLVWKFDRKTKKLELNSGFILMAQNLPKELKKTRNMRGDKEVGVTSISFNCENKESFIIGSEPGAIFKCSMNAHGEPAGSHVVSSVPLRSPVTFTYNPHHGPVYSVEFSPFHRNAFISSAMDQTIRLYTMLQKPPILTVEPGEGFVFSAKWSPTRPTLFAATTESGYLLMYDLKGDQTVPVLKLEASSKKMPVYTCQFNLHQPNLMATGDGSGTVFVFRLSDELKSAQGRENEVLNGLVDIAVEQ